MATRNYLLPMMLKHKSMIGLKGEAAICAEIVSYLKAESISGKFPYVWCHPPNEFSGQYRGAFGAMQHTIGRLCGIADYFFAGKYNSFFIEIKAPKGEQSDYQVAFETWCTDIGVPYYICRSLKDVERVLEIERVKQETIHSLVSNAISKADRGVRENEGRKPLARSPRSVQAVERTQRIV